MKKLFVVLLTVLSFSAVAADAQRPDAASRTYAQNYKDAALALCVAKAYASEPGASKDAAASASGLDNWSEYDAEKGAGKMGELVDKYLAREYHSHQGNDVKLNLMKCIDMYHSAGLEQQVRDYVPHPKRSWMQDNPK
ncbi:Type VI secretion system (T6SS), amidase immunity protein [Kosakonia oryzendophytica]|uniref:Type VI secretion system (T6SS), amidase immunity protein n=1 Tax=Kosakonia oryzendophytica TaxID=1005665 RepID=A0A1C3ZZQ2_9ENTR|nr:T6SS amidase immunity protein Tai4 family protein [Kosakonia oryzendophytica]SCB87848.1 Type VI secretion system (T6SS), amidase immunity protein [Kosakonia oryzendophytica]